jgi:hypothetical protein
MGKMKEVFALHQQEQDDMEKYYSEMYRIATYMGTEEMFKTLYKSSSENKTSNNSKKTKKCQKTK